MENFIYQKYNYRGKFTPNNLVFNANLQEFAARVSYICDLHTSGKITTEDSYKQIDDFWKQLEDSYLKLVIDPEI
ncbi:hypothetical protein HCG51_10495 [Tolypothrix sp. PCC 7910]|uniref:DUF7219 family protein n=1 Tax=Tolypothrix sp. PCC 7910 TaxID=2099387 RepID=UPI0014277C1C|nr:hypothetical protein [Tolypothrix sp. PCC 7910]QIR37116.1 hypothetical protein HCG51_10495 [Tolypothrix sp. PCC 7910]